VKAYQLMNIKLSTVAPDTTTEEIARLLDTGRIDHALVVDEGQQVIGIVDQRNIHRHGQTLQASRTAIPASSVDTPQSGLSKTGDTDGPRLTAADTRIHTIECVDVDDNASDVAWLMSQHDLQFILVLASGQVVGTISRDEIARFLPKERVATT
jgi:CBS domain-containing protein